MNADQVKILRSGNTVGFTASGEHICGKYMSKTKTWRVWVDGGLGGSLSDDRTRSFPDYAAACEFATSLIDNQKTAELAWW